MIESSLRALEKVTEFRYKLWRFHGD